MKKTRQIRQDVTIWQTVGSRVFKLKGSGQNAVGKNDEIVEVLINDFSIEVRCDNCTRDYISEAKEILLAEHIANLLNANPCLSLNHP